MPLRKMKFPLSTPSNFLHSYSFGKFIFPQIKCHLLYFVLILGELVLVPGEVIFDLEELIVPNVYYSMYFAFAPRDLVIALGENSFGTRDLAYNPRELVLPHEKYCPQAFFLMNNLLVMNFRRWT